MYVHALLFQPSVKNIEEKFTNTPSHKLSTINSISHGAGQDEQGKAANIPYSR